MVLADVGMKQISKCNVRLDVTSLTRLAALTEKLKNYLIHFFNEQQLTQ